MLGKLIKYEFRSGWKIIALMNVFVMIVGGLGCFEFNRVNYKDPTLFQMFTMITVLMFYMLTIFAVNIGCSIYIAVRYYKNLYTNEGYLMHTLPVTPRQLLLSKLTVHSLYSIVSALVTVVSIFAFIAVVLANTGEVSDEIFREFLAEFERDLGMSFTTYMLFMTVCSIISTIQGILHIYVSIAIGQMASKYKVLASIGVYIAIYTVMNIIGMIASFAIASAYTFGTISRRGAVYTGLGSSSVSLFGFLIALVMTIVFYAVTEQLMKKKLNLD